MPILGAQYFTRPSVSIPAIHAWVFSENEVKEALLSYLKSKGTNVPNGEIKLIGLESHYDYASNPRLELIVK